MRQKVSALSQPTSLLFIVCHHFFPWSQRLFPEETGKKRKERKETSCLTGSLGVLNALGTIRE